MSHLNNEMSRVNNEMPRLNKEMSRLNNEMSFHLISVSRLSMNPSSCAMTSMSMGSMSSGMNPGLGMFDQHKGAGMQFPLAQRRKRRVLFSQAQVMSL